MSEYDRKDYLMRWGLHSVRGLRCIITHSAKRCSCLPHRLYIYKMCFLKLLMSTPLLFTLPKWRFKMCLFPKFMCSASPQQPTLFGRFALGWPKFGWFALGWPEGKKAGGKRAHIGEAVVGQTVHLLWTPCPSAPTLTKTFLALFLPHPSTVFLFFRTVLSTKIHIQQKIFALHLFRPCFVICTRWLQPWAVWQCEWPIVQWSRLVKDLGYKEPFQRGRLWSTKRWQSIIRSLSPWTVTHHSLSP